MKYSKILFTDLDHTMFQASKYFDNYQDTINCKVASWSDNNRQTPHSFYDNNQLEIFNKFNTSNNTIIPVTNRSIEKYKRTHISDNAKYAIVSMGSILLINNKIDKNWNNIIQSLHLQNSNPIDDLLLFLNDNNIEYVNIDNNYIEFKSISQENINLLQEYVLNNNILIMYSTKKYTSIYPKYINKENTVKYLLDLLIYDKTYGRGDHKIFDYPFVELMDYQEKIVCKKVEY